MKFLIITRTTAAMAGLPREKRLALYGAAKESLDAMLADGTLDCVYTFVTGPRGVAIANAESHKEMWEKLRAYPQDPYMQVEIHPLVDSVWAFDNLIERLHKEQAG